MSEGKRIVLLQTIVIVLSVWLINQLADRYRVQFDLTEEKRYTISDATKRLLQSLDEEVYFEVYLDGDLPSNFERFQKSIGEMLDQFAVESNNRVQYKFTDPAQATNLQARNQFYQSLIDKGVQVTNLNYKNADGDKMEKLIFPGALVSKGIREVPANLLKGNSAAGPEGMLNQSIEGLEYELATAITQLIDGGTKKIAYITGHGSPDSLDIAGFRRTVLSKFDLFNVSLAGRNELSGYDAVIIGKPTQPFTEKEKYLVDQYLMRGGNLIFFIDALSVNMDSASGEGTVAIPYETNLTDQLFRYGVRVNQNYVLDVNSGQFPVVAGNMGNQPQIQMIPWPFFPVLTNFSKHPSVRNLDAILGRFVSEIDTVKAEGISKTPLINTSQYTKLLGPPVRVAFNDLRDELRPEKFTDGPKTVGYLLEGSFTSLYANRLVPKGMNKGSFIERGEPGKVIVIGDGDIIRNDLDPETGEPLGLGVEPFTKTTYANEEFILNILDYMVDESGLIETRSREVKIRPLDRVKVTEQRTKWQLINLVVPVILILIIGVAKWYMRKQKYSK
ncbi:gliding-associated putative ABC transporter substrate-binding component GldG [Ekhidna lutea]|uniref:Gliding-associated putative ABC transporter substrate-binding component GldG n=1 Tax=Ekhidna lutea TaxID=447679 RepID=A0A239L3A0_EKHLU|nr:gliding motility-associated ABC transporter substrate-binding protein GldG [Ekhidna lutea]SNT25066.1 gliding-associated putative ABC transporter substrate-binding component GldG [Ekhidna lutea]